MLTLIWVRGVQVTLPVKCFHPDLGEEGVPWESRFHRDMTTLLSFHLCLRSHTFQVWPE